MTGTHDHLTVAGHMLGHACVIAFLMDLYTGAEVRVSWPASGSCRGDFKIGLGRCYTAAASNTRSTYTSRAGTKPRSANYSPSRRFLQQCVSLRCSIVTQPLSGSWADDNFVPLAPAAGFTQGEQMQNWHSCFEHSPHNFGLITCSLGAHTIIGKAQCTQGQNIYVFFICGMVI